jgi:hypothetical protein
MLGKVAAERMRGIAHGGSSNRHAAAGAADEAGIVPNDDHTVQQWRP